MLDQTWAKHPKMNLHPWFLSGNWWRRKCRVGNTFGGEGGDLAESNFYGAAARLNIITHTQEEKYI